MSRDNVEMWVPSQVSKNKACLDSYIGVASKDHEPDQPLPSMAQSDTCVNQPSKVELGTQLFKVLLGVEDIGHNVSLDGGGSGQQVHATQTALDVGHVPKSTHHLSIVVRNPSSIDHKDEIQVPEKWVSLVKAVVGLDDGLDPGFFFTPGLEPTL